MDAGSDLRLVFTSIQTPNSVEEPLNARLVSRGGVINFWRGTEKIQVDTFVKSECGGMLGPPPTTTASTTGSTESKPQLVLGVESKDFYQSSIMLAKKGKVINIKAGDITKIRLLEDFRINE